MDFDPTIHKEHNLAYPEVNNGNNIGMEMLAIMATNSKPDDDIFNVMNQYQTTSSREIATKWFGCGKRTLATAGQRTGFASVTTWNYKLIFPAQVQECKAYRYIFCVL